MKSSQREDVYKRQVKANLKKGNYFGTMLVKMGVADALLGGATYSTADTVRPALQLIKTKPGNKNVSSCFILVREKDGVEERIAMGCLLYTSRQRKFWASRSGRAPGKPPF